MSSLDACGLPRPRSPRGGPQPLPADDTGVGAPVRRPPVPPPGPAAAGAPDDADWAEVVDLLRTAPTPCLVCHSHPDGDALGSSIAVALGLRELGIPAVVSFDPLEVPASLGFLPGQDLLVPPEQVPTVPELMLTFDSASLDRLAGLADKADAARSLVVVDHHATNTRFGSHHLIDSGAAATAVLADELLTRLGARLTPEIATALYAGLASDTGSFKYACTTPAVHDFAGRLLATGIRHEQIGRSLWDTVRFGYLKLLAAALERARLEPSVGGGAGLVWTVIPAADRAEHGLRLDELEGVIDVVRKASEADVALVLKEDDDGALLGSLRSKGAVDVSVVAGRLGGGGHAAAAGFRVTTSVDEVMAAVRDTLGAAR